MGKKTNYPKKNKKPECEQCKCRSTFEGEGYERAYLTGSRGLGERKLPGQPVKTNQTPDEEDEDSQDGLIEGGLANE